MARTWRKTAQWHPFAACAARVGSGQCGERNACDSWRSVFDRPVQTFLHKPSRDEEKPSQMACGPGVWPCRPDSGRAGAAILRPPSSARPTPLPRSAVPGRRAARANRESLGITAIGNPEDVYCGLVTTTEGA
ncbi:hypothetical protein GCM10010171_31250 [Actinokineospora fastidiosa]|uniref:Uncharacterized protein n=1 Tax=Actinokineospora fastidiosa TaxID=1816 RepID=A0A918GGF4_9PSEU|nr:hypothetical protein GCM10010171_31250 [Actinokineospora fastidiosa]